MWEIHRQCTRQDTGNYSITNSHGQEGMGSHTGDLTRGQGSRWKLLGHALILFGGTSQAHSPDAQQVHTLTLTHTTLYMHTTLTRLEAIPYTNAHASWPVGGYVQFPLSSVSCVHRHFLAECTIPFQDWRMLFVHASVLEVFIFLGLKSTIQLLLQNFGCISMCFFV